MSFIINGKIYLTPEETQEIVSRLSVETKQKVLDLMYQGYNIGAVAELLKLDSSVVAKVILDNIVTAEILSTKVIK